MASASCAHMERVHKPQNVACNKRGVFLMPPRTRTHTRRDIGVCVCVWLQFHLAKCPCPTKETHSRALTRGTDRERRERQREKQTQPAALDGKGGRRGDSMLVLQNPLNYYDCFGYQYSHCATRCASLPHTHTNCMNNSLLNCCNGEE